MNAHTSLGSQPQYRPHDASAHNGPAISAPNVNSGNANACSRKVSRSRVAAGGTDRPNVYGKRRRPRSYPSRTRNRAAGTEPSRKMPDEMITVETWMTNQYDFSAGTSGPTGV